MYRYEACPSNVLGTDSEGQQRVSHNIRTQAGTAAGSGYSGFEFPSYASSSNTPVDRSASSPPLTIRGGSSQTVSQRPPSTTPDFKKSGWIEPLLDGCSRWETAWRLQTAIIGFYVVAFLLAVAHCLFFQYLDGRIISPGTGLSGKRTTTIAQGYVTTISLLLTTAFRTALVASVAVCYTQYLWATLRTRVLKVSLVEDLFQMQTNAFHLANPSIYAKTPILAAVAIFCWLVPIVTVYPPGTLVVELLNSPIDAVFNVSVLHAKDFMYATNPTALSEIWCNYVDGENRDGIGPLELYREEVQQNASFVKTCLSRWGQTDDLRYITRSSLMSGELAALSPPTGENSSYTMQFWGTTLDCETLNRTIQKTITEADISVQDDTWQVPAWVVENFTTPCELWSNKNYDSSFEDPKLTYRVIESSRTYRYFPCLDSIDKTPTADQMMGIVSLPKTGIHVLMNVTETVCRPRLTKYLMTISFPGGKQRVSYLLDKEQPIPQYTKAFQHFNGSYEQWVQFSDALSIYYEFAANLNRSTIVDYPQVFKYTNSSAKSTSYTATNGTTVETCLLNRAPISLVGIYSRQGHRAFDLEIWPLSVFERRYFRPDPEWDSSFSSDCARFDPEIAKELLINTTISALSLKKNFDLVNGTISRAFNVYHFRDKLAFFLPYGLAIGLGIPIIVLGLIAFYKHNQGTSAITGGFLQLLMTTTGRTLLEGVVTGSSTMGGHENVSKELKETKITFGELIAVDDVPPERSVPTHGNSEAPPEDLSTANAALLDSMQQDKRTEGALGVDISEKIEPPIKRAGFGLAQEIQRFRRRNV